MTTALQENHRRGLPEPYEYTAHVNRVLKNKPTLRDRIRAVLSKIVKPKSK